MVEYIRQEDGTTYCMLVAQLNALRYFGVETPEPRSLEFSALVNVTGCVAGPMIMSVGALAKLLGLRVYPVKRWRRAALHAPALLTVYMRDEMTRHQVLVTGGDKAKLEMVNFDLDPRYSLIQELPISEVYIPFVHPSPWEAKIIQRSIDEAKRQRKKRPDLAKEPPVSCWSIKRAGEPDFDSLYRYAMDLVEGRPVDIPGRTVRSTKKVKSDIKKRPMRSNREGVRLRAGPSRRKFVRRKLKIQMEEERQRVETLITKHGGCIPGKIKLAWNKPGCRIYRVEVYRFFDTWGVNRPDFFYVCPWPVETVLRNDQVVAEPWLLPDERDETRQLAFIDHLCTGYVLHDVGFGQGGRHDQGNCQDLFQG